MAQMGSTLIDHIVSESHLNPSPKSGSLPPELLPLILDAVEDGGVYVEDYWSTDVARNLCTYSLVHRSWTRECQARLLHAVVLPWCYLYPGWRRLADRCAGGSEAGAVGPSTRALRIQCECAPRCANAAAYCDHIAAAAPNLRVLRLHQFSPRRVGANLLQCISGLRSLRFLECYVDLYDTLPPLLNALNNLPHLGTLSLTAQFLEEPRIETLPERAFPLQSVRLDSSGTHFPFQFLEWLLRPSPVMPEIHVEELKVTSGEMYFNQQPNLPASLLEHLHHLKRMKLAGWLKRSEVHRIEFFRKCTALETLHTDMFTRIAYGRTSEQFLEVLPASLELILIDATKLGRHVFGEGDAAHFAAADEVDRRLTNAVQVRLGALKRIVLVVRSASVFAEFKFSAIRELCSERSIQLTCAVKMEQLDDGLRW